MFDYLKDFKKVLVTGPQRSGTTLIARAIEHDTELEYVDENEFRATDYSMWKTMVTLSTGIVMQCPGMCRYVHEFGDQDDVAVVMCWRPIDEIIASQERIGWEWEKFELLRYDQTEGEIAKVKYDYWYDYQQHKIKHAFDIVYDDLETHPLWIPADKRLDFDRRQYQL